MTDGYDKLRDAMTVYGDRDDPTASPADRIERQGNQARAIDYAMMPPQKRKIAPARASTRLKDM